MGKIDRYIPCPKCGADIHTDRLYHTHPYFDIAACPVCCLMFVVPRPPDQDKGQAHPDGQDRPDDPEKYNESVPVSDLREAIQAM
jgi:hypothetical protein